MNIFSLQGAPRRVVTSTSGHHPAISMRRGRPHLEGWSKGGTMFHSYSSLNSRTQEKMTR